MKKSRFNSIFRNEDSGCFIYNSFSNSFLHFEESLADFFDSQDDKFDISAIVSKEEFLELKKSNFIYENEKEEESLMLEKLCLYQLQCNGRSLLNLSILPTLGCNFNSSNCYESSRPNISITDDTKKISLN